MKTNNRATAELLTISTQNMRVLFIAMALLMFLPVTGVFIFIIKVIVAVVLSQQIYTLKRRLIDLTAALKKDADYES